MIVGDYQKAIKQAQANAKSSGTPWLVTCWNQQWHTDKMLPGDCPQFDHIRVNPDGEIINEKGGTKYEGLSH